jgi:hypothetical protein
MSLFLVQDIATYDFFELQDNINDRTVLRNPFLGDGLLNTSARRNDVTQHQSKQQGYAARCQATPL